MNAANEVAVAAFLAEQIKFTDIAKLVETTLSNISVNNQESLQCILDADHSARQFCSDYIYRMAGVA